MLALHTRTLLAALLVALLSVGAVAINPTPAAAHHDSNVTQTVESFDTAWELPYKGTQAQQIAYLDHIAAAGFTGVWFAYLTSTGQAFDTTTVLGEQQASLDVDGNIILNQGYADDITWLLDQMNSRGLKAGIVTAWGVRYIHGEWTTGFCENLHQGPLNVDTSYDVGTQLAGDFATHPAVEYWVLGGDNFCGATVAERADPQIWANLAQGLRDGGATQPITFHSSPLVAFMLEFIDEPWLDFLSVETGHCMPPAQMESLLASAGNHPSGKAIFAAEMRYEGFEPEWSGCQEHGPGDPVLPADVYDDTTAAMRAGVTGLLYGHDDRWRWAPNVEASYGAPGETIFMSLVGPHMAPQIYPTTTAWTSSTTSSTTTTSTTIPPTTTSTTSTTSTTTTSTTTTTTTTTTPPPTEYCEGEVATIVGTSGADVLIGTSGRDVIVAKGGNDIIRGRGGNDLICGDGGKDIIRGGSGSDVLVGGTGRDVLKGGSGNDVLRGGTQADKLNGGRGNDYLEGGGGNDRLKGGRGLDILQGGSGADILKGGRGIDTCYGGTGINSINGC